MVRVSMAGRLLTALRRSFGKVVRAGLLGFLLGVGGIELLAAFFNDATATNAGHIAQWPPAFTGTVYTPFVHITAALVGLILGFALALLTATIRTVEGAFVATEDVVNDVDHHL